MAVPLPGVIASEQALSQCRGEHHARRLSQGAEQGQTFQASRFSGRLAVRVLQDAEQLLDQLPGLQWSCIFETRKGPVIDGQLSSLRNG